MPSPRDVLNGCRYTGVDFAELAVTYVHRGAPGDVRTVAGTAIAAIGRAFLTLASEHGPVAIPYHRVVRIAKNGAPLFERHRGAR